MDKFYPGETCKNMSEIKAVVDKVEVWVQYLMQYFDTNEFGD